MNMNSQYHNQHPASLEQNGHSGSTSNERLGRVVTWREQMIVHQELQLSNAGTECPSNPESLREGEDNQGRLSDAGSIGEEEWSTVVSTPQEHEPSIGQRRLLDAVSIEEEEDNQATTVVIEVDDSGLVDQMTMAGFAAQRSRLRLHELMNEARDKTLPEIPSAEASASLAQEINIRESRLSIEININTSPLFKSNEEIFNSIGENGGNVQAEPGGLDNTVDFSGGPIRSPVTSPVRSHTLRNRLRTEVNSSERLREVFHRQPRYVPEVEGRRLQGIEDLSSAERVSSRKKEKRKARNPLNLEVNTAFERDRHNPPGPGPSMNYF